MRNRLINNVIIYFNFLMTCIVTYNESNMHKTLVIAMTSMEACNNFVHLHFHANIKVY